MMITISSPEFTIEGMRANWADDPSLSAAEIAACANAEYAWYVINVGERMRGWSFGVGGTFTGPARNDAVMEILDLRSDAADYVVERLYEIKADVAADQAERRAATSA